MKHDNFNGMRDTFMRILRENHIPRNIYSVMGGYSEDAACLEFNGENWEVYYGYRGIKDARQVYGSIEEALEDMVERVSDSYELEAKMKAELQRTWQTASTVEPGPRGKAAGDCTGSRTAAKGRGMAFWATALCGAPVQPVVRPHDGSITGHGRHKRLSFTSCRAGYARGCR